MDKPVNSLNLIAGIIWKSDTPTYLCKKLQKHEFEQLFSTTPGH